MVNYNVTKVINIQNNNIWNINIKFFLLTYFFFIIPGISTEEDFLSVVELLNDSIQNH